MYYYTTTCLVTILFCYVTVYGQVSDDAVPTITWDYIVLGVGASGSVVASRLSENPSNTVLAIEAGDLSHRSIGGTDWAAPDISINEQGEVIRETPFTKFDVPNLWRTYAYQPSPYPWWPVYFNGNYTNTQSWQGKYVGGSGLHPHVFLRASQQDADLWGQAATGWSYLDVLPFYKKSENATLAGVPYNPFYHGYDGPLHLASTYFGDVSTYLFVASCNATGLPNNTDFNGPTRIGCGTQTTHRLPDGVKDTAANAYLPPALQRSNFKLLINSTILRVLFRPKTGNQPPQAYAVQYIKNNFTFTVQAQKQIIITMGSIKTAQLLLLSGIGDAEQLKSFNIPVVVNNSLVGLNLRNEQSLFGVWAYPGNNFPNGLELSQAALSFALNGSGPYADIGYFGFAYANSDPQNTTYANLNIGITGANPIPGFTGDYVTGQVTPVNPRLNGVVSLHSADPFDAPNLELDVWKYPEDIDVLIAGFRLLRKVLSTPPVNSVITEELYPGPDVDTDEELTQFIISNGGFAGHWSGTASFGNSAATSVVDPSLRVWGVTGLTVGDNSVIPNMGFPSHATALMVGERAAAFVLANNS